MILDEVARNCCNIVTDKIGCLAVKRCLKHGEGTAIDLLVTQIISNAMVLAEDPFGFDSTLFNYFIYLFIYFLN